MQPTNTEGVFWTRDFSMTLISVVEMPNRGFSSKMVYSPSSAGFDMFWSWKVKVSIPRRAVPLEPIPFSISIDGKDVFFGNLTAPLQKVIIYCGLLVWQGFFADKIDKHICRRPLERLSSQEFHPFFPPLRMAFGKVPLHGQCQGDCRLHGACVESPNFPDTVAGESTETWHITWSDKSSKLGNFEW